MLARVEIERVETRINFWLIYKISTLNNQAYYNHLANKDLENQAMISNENSVDFKHFHELIRYIVNNL